MADKAASDLVQVELEKLNAAARLINGLENDAERIRKAHKECVTKYGRELESMAIRVGKTAVQRARMFHDTQDIANKARQEVCDASVEYIQSSSAWEATASTAYLAQALGVGRCDSCRKQSEVSLVNDGALSVLRTKLRDLEVYRTSVEQCHKQKSVEYSLALQKARYLEAKFARSIRKSRPYFELRSKFNAELKTRQYTYSRTQAELAFQKSVYSEALVNLEKLSNNIRNEKFERILRQQQQQPLDDEPSLPPVSFFGDPENNEQPQQQNQSISQSEIVACDEQLEGQHKLDRHYSV